MNKFKLSILVVAALTLTFAGCKKEGVYKLKKKISRIFYESSQSQGKSLRETWTWDGNLLDRITDSDGDFTMFEYDGKRLKTIRNSDGSRLEFTYDGSKVKECNDYSSSGNLDGIYSITHDGGKISKITITKVGNNTESLKRGNLYFLLNYMLPDTRLAENIQNLKLAKSTKENVTTTVSFDWEGENISKSTIEMSAEGFYYNVETKYTYDKKSNPYYNSLSDVMKENFLGLNKNNITKAANTATISVNNRTESGYNEVTYTYTYDGKFPTEQKSDGGKGKFEITYYEYQ